MKMTRILDSSGVINARDKELEGDYLTVPGVEKELKDIQSRLKFQAALDTGKIRLEEPSKKALGEIRDEISKLGSTPLLSKTDIQLLALAHETKLPLLTDDYDMQNVCKELDLRFERISHKGIEKVFRWKKKCPACGAIFEKDLDECEICGTRLKTIRK